MMSFIIFTVLLFAVLWAWIAYEYQRAITISIDDEMELDGSITFIEEQELANAKNYKILSSTGLRSDN